MVVGRASSHVALFYLRVSVTGKVPCLAGPSSSPLGAGRRGQCRGLYREDGQADVVSVMIWPVSDCSPAQKHPQHLSQNPYL